MATQAPAHPSPNAGVAEAAFAAALGIHLGGTNRYGERTEVRPQLGWGRGARPDDIAQAIRLSRDVGTALASSWRLAAASGGGGTVTLPGTGQLTSFCTLPTVIVLRSTTGVVQMQRSPVRSRRCPATVVPFEGEPGRLLCADEMALGGRAVRAGPPVPLSLDPPFGRRRIAWCARLVSGRRSSRGQARQTSRQTAPALGRRRRSPRSSRRWRGRLPLQVYSWRASYC